MGKQKPVIIINESELYKAWFVKDMLLIKEIDPVKQEKKRLINEMRQYLLILGAI
jgi:prophage antirepressor-like protein